MSEPHSNPLSVYLIRHGETAWSISHQHTGVTDIPLTEDGNHGARQVGTRLKAVAFRQVFSSPAKRAKETCILAGFGSQMVIDPRLVEWNYGKYEGMKTVAIREARPDWNIFQDGCPQGESAEQIGVRADGLITFLLTLKGNIALFTHGQYSSVFTARWLGLPVINGDHFILGTSSIGILSFDPDHIKNPVLGAWNI